MNLKSSTITYAFGVIAGILSLINGARGIEYFLKNDYADLKRIFAESNGRKIVVYNHHEFAGWFIKAYDNLSKQYNPADPLNYISVLSLGGMVWGYHLRKRENAGNQTPENIPPSRPL